MKEFNRVKCVKNEHIALNYIKRIKKYKIIETNYKNKIGEIDIIAKDKDCVVFIEVKYRQAKTFGYGRETVDNRKINKIRQVATQYLLESNLYNNKVRFDVVDILGEDIEYIENAF